MKIGIVGLGLIGGSLGLDLRRAGHWVMGMSRRAETNQQALAMGAIDQMATDVSDFAVAEVVFLCPPIASIVPIAQQLIPHLAPHTILTDVGSVKQPIVEAIAPLWPNFIGGHPMAGTADSGIEAAHSGLFQSAPYVLTPSEDSSAQALAVLESLVRSLGSRVFHCPPAVHDQAVALISHLPVMISASLVATCAHTPNPSIQTLAQNLASSGFRDTSRVGGGNPQLGVMMAQYNRTALLESLQQYRQSLDLLTNFIEREDWPALENFLVSTQKSRPDFMNT